MSTIRPFRISRQDPQPDKAVAERMAERDFSDAQALKELIEILKQPYPSSCDKCDGLGIVPGKGSCVSCQGTGRVLMQLL